LGTGACRDESSEGVAELPQRLISTLAGFLLSVVDEVIDQWRKKFDACVGAQGGHFEQFI